MMCSVSFRELYSSKEIITTPLRCGSYSRLQQPHEQTLSHQDQQPSCGSCPHAPFGRRRACLISATAILSDVQSLISSALLTAGAAVAGVFRWLLMLLKALAQLAVFFQQSINITVQRTYLNMLRVNRFSQRLKFEKQSRQCLRYVINLLFHRYKDGDFI